MDSSTIRKVVSEVMLEKTLSELYCKGGTCVGWERNVVDQPAAVNNIVSAGADRIAAGEGAAEEKIDGQIARMIDHTLLKPEATDDDIVKICAEAKKYQFASVCVNPSYVKLCRRELSGSGVKVCTVIGFPLGANTTTIKRAEAAEAIANGADEVDMVMHVGRLKQGDYKYVFEDIQQVVIEANRARVVTKVILETALLTDEEKIKACVIAREAGANFVKTSTGFSKGGATAGDVALMKYVVGSTVKVKASGGIRSREDVEAMIAGGAERIGASASVKIVTGQADTSGGY